MSAFASLEKLADQVPKGYVLDRDGREDNYPTVEWRAEQFARLPSIQLRTVERSVLIDGGYVTRRFWGLATGAISGEMGITRIAEFRAALDHAEQVMRLLRAQEISRQPAEVLEAFSAERLGPESVFEEEAR